MRVLIVPMAAMAETAGPFRRTVLLAQALTHAGIEAATCCAEDVNYRPIEGIKHYRLSAPMPLGLPKCVAEHSFPMAQKLGITSRKTVRSFDDVLHLTGNTDGRYLKKSVADIRNAIQAFAPDVIYSEFNLSAVIAGKAEGKPVYSSASIPTQASYSSTPKYAHGLNKLLKSLSLPPVRSCLDVFSWSDKRFVPSCYELEPFQGENVVFCGAWRQGSPVLASNRRSILVYMGNGTISQKKMVRETVSAFRDSAYSVYIAGRGLPQRQIGANIHIAARFDFQALLPQSALFLHHGGQNSMIDALVHGVPQLVCPGKVFERRYNAESLVRTGAGILLPYKTFSAASIRAASETILSTQTYQENAHRLGSILLSLGGVQAVIAHLTG